jgi:hypothetical protein
MDQILTKKDQKGIKMEHKGPRVPKRVSGAVTPLQEGRKHTVTWCDHCVPPPPTNTDVLQWCSSVAQWCYNGVTVVQRNLV